MKTVNQNNKQNARPELDLFCLHDGCTVNCDRLKNGDCPFSVSYEKISPEEAKARLYAIYVDALHPCTPTQRWRFTMSCHLYGRDLEALHAFAARLGLRRAWFQEHSKLPHYDLTENKRAQALRMGAVAMEIREVMDVHQGKFYWKADA